MQECKLKEVGTHMKAMPEQTRGMAVWRFFSWWRLLLHAMRVITMAALTYRMAEMRASLALYQAWSFGLAAQKKNMQSSAGQTQCK